MAKVTFEFDDTDPDDRDKVRKFVHVDDVLSKLDDAYNLARTRRKHGENVDEEQYDFLTELMCLLCTEAFDY